MSFQKHKRCGMLNGGGDGVRVWMTCEGCGAGFSRSRLRADKLRPRPVMRRPVRAKVQ
jgi:hypothetical protein